MATNEFLPFAIGAGANVLDQSDYAELGALSVGFAPGLAYSDQLNKVWRQATFPGAGLSQFMVNELDEDVQDNGDLPTYVDQLTRAIQAAAPREKLTGPYTVFVSLAGSDSSGDGSAGNPFLTLQHAWNFVIGSFDFSGQTVTIQLTDGTYNAGLVAAGAAIGGTATASVIITGNASNSANVVISVTGADGIVASNGAGVIVQNLTVRSTAVGSSGGAALAATWGGFLGFRNVIFGASTFYHVFATQGGNIQAINNYSITGGAEVHMSILGGAFGQMSATGGGAVAVVITLTGNPNFSVGFVQASSNGTIYAPLCNFVGTATGPRYQAVAGGVIDTEGANNGNPANYFPGSAVGTLVNGGILN